MRSTGIRRKVDDLGRVVIPASIRRSLHIREGDEIEVHVDGEHVILAKPTVRCVLCGTEDGDLKQVRERRLCRACIASVGVLDESLRERAREAAASVRPGGWQPPAAVVEPPPQTSTAPDLTPDADGQPDVVAAWPPPAASPADADPRPAPASRDDHAATRDRSRERAEDDLYDPASTTAW